MAAAAVSVMPHFPHWTWEKKGGERGKRRKRRTRGGMDCRDGRTCAVQFHRPLCPSWESLKWKTVTDGSTRIPAKTYAQRNEFNLAVSAVGVNKQAARHVFEKEKPSTRAPIVHVHTYAHRC